MASQSNTPVVAQFFKSIALSLAGGCCCPKPDIVDGKNALVFLQLVYFIALIVLRETAADYAPDKLCDSPPELQTREVCLRDQVSIRLSMALMIEFFLLLLMTLCTFGYHAVTGCFIAKLVVPVGIFFASLYVPEDWSNVMEYICGGFCMVNFLFLMVFVLNFGIKWNDLWTANSMEDQRNMKSGKSWLVALVTFAILFIIMATVITGYYGYKTNFDATRQAFNVLLANYIVMFIILILSLLTVITHGSLLVSAIILAFLSSIAWGAALRYPGINKPLTAQELDVPVVGTLSIRSDYTTHDYNGFIVVMLFWLICALVTSARESKAVSTNEGPNEVDIGITELEVKDENKEGGFDLDMGKATENKEGTKTTTPEVAYGPTLLFFLFHMSIAGAAGTFFNRTPREEVFWIYAAANWVGIVLYFWYLIAPKVLGNHREFS